MAPLDRLRRKGQAEDERDSPRSAGDRSTEESLRARLSDDPNDVEAFDALAELVRARSVQDHEHAESHPVEDPQREADDAVWALAEEIAQNGRAWYPLIELARLSIDDDREVALRRLATAADRDPTGVALAAGLAMLRQTGHADDALGLGVGHWRPREHHVDAGRQLIEASIEAGRLAEARRHLEAMTAHPDTAGVEKIRQELGKRLTKAERGGGGAGPRHEPSHHRGTGSHHVVDVREGGPRLSASARLRAFLRF
jgi:hypothetical protein